jgi:hypothetical protein
MACWICTALGTQDLDLQVRWFLHSQFIFFNDGEGRKCFDRTVAAIVPGQVDYHLLAKS